MSQNLDKLNKINEMLSDLFNKFESSVYNLRNELKDMMIDIQTSNPFDVNKPKINNRSTVDLRLNYENNLLFKKYQYQQNQVDNTLYNHLNTSLPVIDDFNDIKINHHDVSVDIFYNHVNIHDISNISDIENIMLDQDNNHGNGSQLKINNNFSSKMSRSHQNVTPVNANNNKGQISNKMTKNGIFMSHNEFEKDEFKYSQKGSLKESTNSGKVKEMESNSDKIRMKMDMNDVEVKKFNAMLQELNKQPKCVFVLDSKLDILWQNEVVTQQMLQTKEELICSPLSSIIPSEIFKDVMIILNRYIEDAKTSNMNNSTIHKSSSTFEEVLPFECKILDKSLRETSFRITPKINVYQNHKQQTTCNVILQMETIHTEHSYVTIDPRHILYLMWSLVIFQIIVFLVFQVPQDLAFSDPAMEEFNFHLDLSVTAIFTFDILLCFFLAQEEVEGKQVFNNYLIAKNQLTNSFLFDIVATVPFDMVIKQIAINTSIIKSVKIIKIFKLLQILKVSKVLSLRNNTIRNALGQDLISMIKGASGFFDLILQNLYILIGSHQQTILFYQIKINQLTDPKDKDWLSFYFQIDERDNFSIQLQMLIYNVKTALGLGTQTLVDKVEILLQTSWMFIGLSMFGQGIGNISSYLNQTNQNEIEYNDTKAQFLEICELYNVDPRITLLIKRDIDNYYRNQNEMNLSNKKKVLSPVVFTQLESSIYKEFIESFSLLPRLNISIIRQIKNNINIVKGKINLLKGSVINEVYFILGGRLTLQDLEMRLYNQQENDEIFGFGKFIKLVNLKYKVEIDKLLENIYVAEHSGAEPKDQLDKLKVIKEYIRERMLAQQPKQKGSSELEDIHKFAEEDNIIMTNSMVPISSEDLEQFAVPFTILEGILLNDFDSFHQIWRYWRISREMLSEQDIENSEVAMARFDNTKSPGVILTEKGEVQSVNSAIANSQEEWVQILTGKAVTEFIRQEKETKRKVEGPEDLETNKYYKILVGKTKQWIKINEIIKMYIKTGVSQTIDEDDEDNEPYFLMKKSLIPVQIIQFEIEPYKRA